ncbi:MAG TPA: hypothetical protein VIK95_06790 [Egibacteraceae bacterium]
MAEREDLQRQDVEQERRSRGAGDRDSAAPRSAEAVLLGLQRSVGNAAVTRAVAALRAEEDEHPAGPDWSAPIEPEADERAEEGRAEAAAVQRHADEETVDWRSEPVQRAAAAGAAVQRQGGAAVKTFPGFKSIRYNATVANAAWKAWAETLRATTKTSRREQGFWIQWDATTVPNATGKMKTVGHVTGTVVGNNQGATINLGAKPADSGDWYTVGSFHTHTPTRHRAVGRVVGPSGADHNADTSDNVAGLVYDYLPVKNGAIPAGHPIWSKAKIWHSGPVSRT